MRVNWRDRSGFDRRSFFALIAAGMPAALALSSCGIPGIHPKPFAERAVRDESADHILNWANWPLYIDLTKGPHGDMVRPTLLKFQAETGMKVNYSEDISDNDVYFGKLRPLLATGADPGIDLMVITDWMAARLERYGWVQPFRRENVPNLANIDRTLPSNAFDPGLEFAAPYVYGLISIAYNAKATKGKPVKSINQMLTDPALRGKVALLSEMEQTVSLVMMDNGIDPSHFTDAQFDQTLGIIKDAINREQIKAFTGNEYTQGLSTGDYAACVVYSGDVIQLQGDHPEIKFVFPDSGAKVYTDNFMIPSYARHKTNAEKLINFYYDPFNSARLFAYIQYISPAKGTRAAMQVVDPSLVNNDLIFPTPEQLAKLKVFKKLTGEEELRYFSQYQDLIGV